MKVKCITNECIDLIEGKIYEAQIEYFHGHKMLCIKDESGDYYLYSMQDYEIIEDYVWEQDSGILKISQLVATAQAVATWHALNKML